ncbi:MAG: hypothetical protein A3F35_01895 [Candidatus Woykebacteria bacterium RIFCSPHIGHO2_12_FULL_45_10]|uniref:G5 domain-containing protein n=1 Tax=Candidatus Woykebacteria bacterium RIFCSPHIGHO2_12_FULL_45_10 TaxID=1802603 RepID=A0A1G1WRS4_9BACT|nr:MAG: hypothetical protein A3F35_01895 [Candidatus Woykebacteria bacterium RIFCSPHIGHO2_12_FULL_45_10]
MSTLVALAGGSRTATSTAGSFLLLILARLPFKLVGGTFILFLVLPATNTTLPKNTFVGAEKLARRAFPITETTRTTTSEIGFTRKDIPDNNLQVGETKVIQEGKMGQLQNRVRTLSFQGREFTHDLLESKTIEPQALIVAFGTMKHYQSLDTPTGPVNYWSKLRVYSTSYDSHCKGCNQTTSIGLKAGYGVVAVDPKVIPLRTRLYIPGYGFAIAGDTGGSIKGDKIDLGFDDVKTGWWSSRFTDIYLLSE